MSESAELKATRISECRCGSCITVTRYRYQKFIFIIGARSEKQTKTFYCNGNSQQRCSCSLDNFFVHKNPKIPLKAILFRHFIFWLNFLQKKEGLFRFPVNIYYRTEKSVEKYIFKEVFCEKTTTKFQARHLPHRHARHQQGEYF